MKAMVIGLGRIGWSYSQERGRGLGSSHFGAYYLHKDIDSIIAVDSDQKRLSECAEWFRNAGLQKERKKEVVFVDNYNDALEKWSPDIASVCVPTPLHHDMMRDLCRDHSPTVICLEKPIAPSLLEANRIAARVAQNYAQRNKPKVAVNFHRRWDERYELVKSQIDIGRIGKPAVALGLHPGPLLRTGIHMLDLFNWYLGEPDRLIGMTETTGNWMTEKFPGTNDWSGSCVIHYKNGSYAILANMGLDIARLVLFELFIYGDEGAVKIEDNGRSIRIQQTQDSEHYADLKEFKTQDQLMRMQSGEENQMTRVVDDLVQCVKDPNRAPRCTIEDALRAQTLVHMIRQCKTGGDVGGRVMCPETLDFGETIRSH